MLVGTAQRIRSYSGQDPELSAIAGLLEREDAVYAAPMPEDARKPGAFREREPGAPPGRRRSVRQARLTAAWPRYSPCSIAQWIGGRAAHEAADAHRRHRPGDDE